MIQNPFQIENTIYKAQISKATYLPHILLIPAFFIGFITLFIQMLINNNTILKFTNKRIIGKTGIFGKDSLESPLNKITSVKTKQDLAEKIFNYGKIYIHTACGQYLFRGIKNPNEFRSALMQQIDIYEQEKIMFQAQQIAYSMRGH